MESLHTTPSGEVKSLKHGSREVTQNYNLVLEMDITQMYIKNIG